MSVKGLKCFISYSHADKKMCDRFRKHLEALSRLYPFEAWYDGMIPAGGEIDKIILQQLKESDIILLLISPDFIASYYCYEKELKTAINRHRAGKCVVVPVICKPFVSGTYPFSGLKFVPTDGRPINAYRPQDGGYTDACTGIGNLIKDFIEQDSIRLKASTTRKASKPATANKGIKYPVIKNGKTSSVLLTQDTFNVFVKYSSILPQFINRINDITNQQLQSLSLLMAPNTPLQTRVAYEKKNFEVYLIQIFSYIQQVFIGIDNTCAHFRYKNDEQYLSLVNIGYPSIKLSTKPIAASGGMIECALINGCPVVKSYNNALHNKTHPEEVLLRDYVTFTFPTISQIYDIDLSMCISIVGKSSSISKNLLAPLSVLRLDKFIESSILRYVAGCKQLDSKYNLENILKYGG